MRLIQSLCRSNEFRYVLMNGLPRIEGLARLVTSVLRLGWILHATGHWPGTRHGWQIWHDTRAALHHRSTRGHCFGGRQAEPQRGETSGARCAVSRGARGSRAPGDTVVFTSHRGTERFSSFFLHGRRRAPEQAGAQRAAGVAPSV